MGAVAEYRWSGYVLATLLPYLEEKHQIDLMKSEELAAFLTNTTRATHFIFTPANGLEPKSFSEEAMRQYFNEFNATNEQEIGRAMSDGVSALRESLGQIEDSSVVVFSISENRQLRRSQKYRRTQEGLVRNDNSIPPGIPRSPINV